MRNTEQLLSVLNQLWKKKKKKTINQNKPDVKGALQFSRIYAKSTDYPRLGSLEWAPFIGMQELVRGLWSATDFIGR